MSPESKVSSDRIFRKRLEMRTFEDVFFVKSCIRFAKFLAVLALSLCHISYCCPDDVLTRASKTSTTSPKPIQSNPKQPRFQSDSYIQKFI